MKNKSKGYKPFLKWAGGKRWLAPQLAPLLISELNKTGGNYIEPFVGAGAMFFAIQPEKSVLSDISAELINVYKQVQKNWIAITNELRRWPVERDFYYEIRNNIPKTSFLRACRFLYLNRTCYGGLYRENQSGQFNVPYGGGDRKPNALWEDNLLQNSAESLKGDVSFIVSDFEKIVSRAKAGDVVYCDPTYSTKKRKQFDRYGKTVFNWKDQMRLAMAAENAMDRGALVLISNSACLQLKEFYPRAYRLELQRAKSIGNKASCASTHNESLYILDPLSQRRKWQKLGEITNKKMSISVNASLSDKILEFDNKILG